MFIELWLLATIIFIAALIITPFCFKTQGIYDFGTPIIIAFCWFLEVVAYLIFWIIFLAAV